MYGYNVSFYDYGFSDPAITGSIYGNSISPMAAAVDYDDELYVRRRPPPRERPPIKAPSSPPKHRRDGTSPLPLGMDWSLAPLIWEGRNSVWPHDLHKGWSYCVTIPSLSSLPSDSISKSNTVFYGVKVGIQSPEGITTTRTVPRRFNEFLKLYSELKKEFPKKNLPPAPPRTLIKTTSKKVLAERMSALECWITKLLSDIDVSRTATVAIFLELEAAARQACCEMDLNESSASEMDNSCVAHETPISEKENCAELDTEEVWRKCMELELRLTMEQEARAYAESMKETTMKKNELLAKELDDANEQVEILRKQKEEMELKSKSDVKEAQLDVESARKTLKNENKLD